MKSRLPARHLPASLDDRETQQVNCVCHKCTASLQPDRTVVLWDGNVYCLSCLDAKDPSLATYASSHNMLEEQCPVV